ncbi:hypothetical protein SLS63_006543 [Diaporthe eres]|uniref:Uncharacterized protein n=1 Tax=Diaporthe eres TaxID=83184 RepID=A0ABR1P7X1_DIAER
MPSRLSANFIRLVAFRQPSEYREIGGIVDTTVEQTIECDIGLTAYNYTKASSVTNSFSIDDMERIPLDDGHLVVNSSVDDQVDMTTGHKDMFSYILFNTTGLPDFRVRTLELGSLIDYFTSDSFSGKIADGESVPSFAAGITNAIRNPQKNISKILDSMAITMTDQLRTNNNAIARGLTARTVVLVRVQWAWLTLPFFVVLASGLFLIAEMVVSRRKTDIRLWKSSATSLLFHSISPAEGRMRTSIQDPEQLHRTAKATKIRLESPGQSDQSLLSRVTHDQERHPHN